MVFTIGTAPNSVFNKSPKLGDSKGFGEVIFTAEVKPSNLIYPSFP